MTAEGQEIIPAGAPIGRPLKMTREIEDIICVRLALGESLIEICEDDDLPSRKTVFLWLNDERSGDFRDRYARAREDQGDSFFELVKAVADDGRNDWMEKHDKDGNLIGWMVNGEHVQRSRLRVDALKWMAGKLRPKKYGERLDLTTGGDKLPAPSSDADVATRLAALIEDARQRQQKDEGNG